MEDDDDDDNDDDDQSTCIKQNTTHHQSPMGPHLFGASDLPVPAFPHVLEGTLNGPTAEAVQLRICCAVQCSALLVSY